MPQVFCVYTCLYCMCLSSWSSCLSLFNGDVYQILSPMCPWSVSSWWKLPSVWASPQVTALVLPEISENARDQILEVRSVIGKPVGAHKWSGHQFLGSKSRANFAGFTCLTRAQVVFYSPGCGVEWICWNGWYPVKPINRGFIWD